MSMTWEAPAYREIRMDAEIGSYQEDFDGPNTPVVEANDDDAPGEEA
jgi:hypothetical protein